MRKLSNDTITLFLGEVICRGLGFLATRHLATILGTSGFGIITIGLSVLSYVVLFSDLGISMLSLRELSKLYDKRLCTLQEVLVAKLISTVIFLLISLLLINVFVKDQIVREVTLNYLFCVFPFMILIEWVYLANRKVTILIISRVITSILYCFLVFRIKNITQIKEVPLIYFIALLSGAIILCVVYFSTNNSKINFKITLNKLKLILRNSIPIGIGGMFAQGIQLFPPIVLGIYVTKESAGLFGAASKIIFLLLVIDRIFAQIFIPRISEVWSKDISKAKILLSKSLKIVVGISVLIPIIVIPISEIIMRIVFNKDYLNASTTLAILTLFVSTTLINSFYSLSLVAINKGDEYLKVSVVSGLISIALISLGASNYGLLGVSISVVISELFMMLYARMKFVKIVYS
ncbi:MAG: oligosaccharide flippase family protein [Candidatus Kapaibacterium sp.]